MDKVAEVFIIDFDSTLTNCEALDKLAQIVLKKNPENENITQKIAAITAAGMEGKLSFRTSLGKRLRLLKITKSDIRKLTAVLKRNLSASIKRNRQFFKDNAERIYIISGGFKEFIVPIAGYLGISASHVLANTFIYRKDEVTGFDTHNPLSQNQGKVKAVAKLNLQGKIIVIGDSYTDYEIKKAGIAHKFYAFCENVKRDTVVKVADKILYSLDDLLFIKKLPRSQSFPKSKMKVLLLENIHKQAVDKFLLDGYQVETVNSSLGEEELLEIIGDVSLLGIRSKTTITGKILERAQKLLSIGAFCIGTNQIDLKSSAQKGVAVFNAPYSNTRSVVELIIGEIIMLSRSVFPKSTLLHDGIWDKSAKGSHEIRGKNLGIIGYGNIGSQLSVLAENLGMKVFFFDLADKLALGNAVKSKSLKELLTLSDILTIHVDGRPENTNLISGREFKLMKDGVLLLNASRGHVVDINSLADNLQNGKVRAAAIDVFPQEPKSNSEKFISPLTQFPNVILTPHIGGSTLEAQASIGEYVSEKLLNYVNSGDTYLSVNFPQVSLPSLKDAHRIIHIHKNVPGVLAKINDTLAQHHINIEGQYLKTNDEIGYVITDVNKIYEHSIVTQLKNIPQTQKVRVLY